MSFKFFFHRAENVLVADVNGLSDPYCILKFKGNLLFKTNVHFMTLNPIWDEEFVVKASELKEYDVDGLIPLSLEYLEVEVWDKDQVSKDDPLGIIRLPLAEFANNVNDVWRKILPFSMEGHIEDCGKILIGTQVIGEASLPSNWSRAHRIHLSDIFPSDSFYFERLYATGSNPQHVSVFFPLTSTVASRTGTILGRKRNFDGETVLFRHVNTMRRILPSGIASKTMDDWGAEDCSYKAGNGIGVVVLTNFRLIHFPPASLPVTVLEPSPMSDLSSVQDLSFRRMDATSNESGDTGIVQVLLPMISKCSCREVTSVSCDMMFQLKTGMTISFRVVRNMLVARESSLDFDQGLCSTTSKPVYWVNRVVDEVNFLIKEDMFCQQMRLMRLKFMRLQSNESDSIEEERELDPSLDISPAIITALISATSSSSSRTSRSMSPTKIQNSGRVSKKFRFPTFSFHAEFNRLGIPDANWRLVTLNENYDMSPTYPNLIVIPTIVTDDEITEAANQRSKARFPAFVWIHPLTRTPMCRSSQPKAGVVGDTAKDTKLLLDIHATCPSRKSVRIVDARPRINAEANAIMGKGFERVSKMGGAAEIDFMDIENIHVMRESVSVLISALAQCYPDKNATEVSACDASGVGLRQSSIDEADNSFSNIWQKIVSSKWLYHVSLVLAGAEFAAASICRGHPVVVHCSDGWDRTSQLTSLSQILLDPYYRTISGFKILIEKEWCGFGHMFAKRSSASKEQSPVFLQFLDCVWQLLQQFPREFEFTENFLVLLAELLYSHSSTTFLTNCEKERRGLELELFASVTDEFRTTHQLSESFSAWEIIECLMAVCPQHLFVNPLYCSPMTKSSSLFTPTNDVPVATIRRIIPRCEEGQMQLWRRFYSDVLGIRRLGLHSQGPSIELSLMSMAQSFSQFVKFVESHEHEFRDRTLLEMQLLKQMDLKLLSNFFPHSRDVSSSGASESKTGHAMKDLVYDRPVQKLIQDCTESPFRNNRSSSITAGSLDSMVALKKKEVLAKLNRGKRWTPLLPVYKSPNQSEASFDSGDGNQLPGVRVDRSSTLTVIQSRHTIYGANVSHKDVLGGAVYEDYIGKEGAKYRASDALQNDLLIAGPNGYSMNEDIAQFRVTAVVIIQLWWKAVVRTKNVFVNASKKRLMRIFLHAELKEQYAMAQLSLSVLENEMKFLAEAIVDNVCDIIERKDISDSVQMDTAVVRRVTVSPAVLAEMSLAVTTGLPEPSKRGTMSKILKFRDKIFQKL